MNDLFFKFIEKLGSIDNTLLFAVSINPKSIFLFYLYKIKSVNIFSILLIYLILRKNTLNKFDILSYSFILGGTIGNGIDRIIKVL